MRIPSPASRLPVGAVLVNSLLLAACAALPPLRADEPGQAVAGDPASARSERDGLALTARPDDWRGWPQDLADHLTPVEVLVENRTGHPIELGPEDVSLVLPDGRRLAPLPAWQVRGHLRSRSAEAIEVRYPSGLTALGPLEPWPFGPDWWGQEAWASPGLTDLLARPVARQALATGRSRSLLLLFPVPATRLQRLAVELAPGGLGAGGPRVDFARRPAGT
jgi:hypothetical protein